MVRHACRSLTIMPVFGQEEGREEGATRGDVSVEAAPLSRLPGRSAPTPAYMSSTTTQAWAHRRPPGRWGKESFRNALLQQIHQGLLLTKDR